MKRMLLLAVVCAMSVCWGEEAPPNVAELAKTKIAATSKEQSLRIGHVNTTVSENVVPLDEKEFKGF